MEDEKGQHHPNLGEEAGHYTLTVILRTMQTLTH